MKNFIAPCLSLRPAHSEAVRAKEHILTDGPLSKDPFALLNETET